MKLIPESISVYVWAAIGGGAIVVVILVFWCIYRSVKKALKKGMSVRESATLRMERNSTHLAEVALQQPQRSPTWYGKDKSWSGLGKDYYCASRASWEGHKRASGGAVQAHEARAHGIRRLARPSSHQLLE
jgi:hypothetical protein